MALCFVKETDRHGNEVSQIPMRRFDEPTAMARALLEYDSATWVPFMGSFGSLDTHGFAESEPCDNTFTSHEDATTLACWIAEWQGENRFPLHDCNDVRLAMCVEDSFDATFGINPPL